MSIEAAVAAPTWHVQCHTLSLGVRPSLFLQALATTGRRSLVVVMTITFTGDDEGKTVVDAGETTLGRVTADRKSVV